MAGISWRSIRWGRSACGRPPAPRWARRGRPERQRATYHKRHGTRYVFGAYDLHEDRLRVRLRRRRRGRDNLAFMAPIRGAIPARRLIYWIQDVLSANWTPDIRAYAAAHRIELVPTPTYASYLNPVECHFFPIAEFVVNNADYLDWDAFAWRWPATSSTATARTAPSASGSSKPVTRSPP